MFYLGNYVGVICLVIVVSCVLGIESFFFLVDLYSLIKLQDLQCIQCVILEIVVSWLVCGLDLEYVWFYCQSDICEIIELMWFLIVIVSKGIFNCVYVYKVVVDKNCEEGVDEDVGVSVGLFMYLVLMVVDILIFKVNQVLVGCDQIQYIEMVCDFVQCFNYVYGKEYFLLLDVVIDEQVVMLVGLDGCKMSKSYYNIILLFVLCEELKKLVFLILIDLCVLGELKDIEGLVLFQMYQVFVILEQIVEFVRVFVVGISWGDVKQQLFECIDSELLLLCECYNVLMVELEKIEVLFKCCGQQLCEQLVVLLLDELCYVVGLCDLFSVGDIVSEDVGVVCVVLLQFKQYCEKDGCFYFKLIVGDGMLLIQSEGFDLLCDVGQLIVVIKQVEQGDQLQSELFKLDVEVDVVLVVLVVLCEV